MNILVPDISVGEKLVRSVVVYGFLLIAFRLCARKRQVQDAVNGDDNLRRERLGPAGSPGRPGVHHGVVSVRDIRYAFLEEDGHVSVIAGRPRGE